MYKLLFSIFSDPLGLPISYIWEYIILFLLNLIAYKVAWNASPGGSFGSEIHWIVRTVVFAIIWLVTYALIFISKWILANWKVLLIISTIVFVLLLTYVFYIRNNN